MVPLLELEGHEVPVRKMRRGRVMMYRLWINKMVMMMVMMMKKTVMMMMI